MRIITRALCLFVLATLVLCSAAFAAEQFPTRSITYMVTFDPGGQSDREARRQQPLLAEILKQNVNIDYKVGGGGAIGWKELVGSRPDGYTIAGFNIPHVILQPMQQNVGFQTEQIVPVAIFQRTFLGLAVLKDSPLKSVQDVLDAAKKNPGKVTMGGVGVYSGHHIAQMQLQKLSGVKITYVPATGSASQMTTFLGGHTSVIMANQDDLWRFRDKLNVLAMTTDGRSPLFPDSPSFKELGYDMVLSIDRGVAVPPKTPAAVISVLENAFLKIANMPEVREAMEKEGFTPVAMGHEESVQYIKRLTEEFAELLKSVKN